ncbi:MAG: ribosomal protein S18-alanine N-acetyltransferase [Deltaproteobacteria bacterium]|nr:ribosomal protein S18-alanine N-acetyltransferase [Deltaproteobacteria bacterium]MBI2342333.1 ribosomal protein S18-alanine N-acetyltransferase [Deltaproteobacteria bacterium]MBI2974709.1 ribosomal protein S18-alanine N-acetyltransferase [Deltaproteobacteria bacterium]
MIIRKTMLQDIDKIVAIEEASFSAPFDRRMFQGMIIASPPFGGFVLENDGVISGYLFYSIALDEMELLTIAVDEKFRRKGYAKRLIEEMFRLAREKNAKSIFLEVRVSNSGAQSLYKSFGFLPAGVRKAYYRDNGEDAIVMKRNF